MLQVARGLADGPLILTAAFLGTMLMVPRWSMRSTALKASVAAAATLLANLIIGLIWDRARPFVAGAGQAWVSHAARSEERRVGKEGVSTSRYRGSPYH